MDWASTLFFKSVLCHPLPWLLTHGIDSPPTSSGTQLPPCSWQRTRFSEGRQCWWAPLHCAHEPGRRWTLPSTPEARTGAKNQEKEQPKQSTSMCCTLKYMSMCQSRKAHNKGLSWAGLFMAPFLTLPPPSSLLPNTGTQPFSKYSRNQGNKNSWSHSNMNSSLIKKATLLVPCQPMHWQLSPLQSRHQMGKGGKLFFFLL